MSLQQFAMVLVVLLSTSSCYALNDWTVCWYFSAEDDKSAALEAAMVETIERLQQIGSDDRVEYVVQVDSGIKTNERIRKFYPDCGTQGATRFLIKSNEAVNEGNLGEVNMGSPYTLWECMKWVATDHRARNYFFILGGHGSGPFSWRGVGGTNDDQPGRVNFDPDNFVAYDSKDNDTLTVFEVAAVFDAFKTRLNRGRNIPLVAFDTCLAGSLEVLYELRSSCDVVVASPDTIPIGGFDYYAPAIALKANPQIEPSFLAEFVVKAFIYNASTSGEGNCLAAWRMSEIEELAGAMDQLSRNLLRGVSQTQGSFLIRKGLYKLWDGDLYWDLECLLRAIVDGHTYYSVNKQEVTYDPGDIVESAAYARDVLQSARVARWYSGKKNTNKIGGLSITWPSHENYRKYRPFYQALSMSRDLGWDEFLDYRIGIFH